MASTTHLGASEGVVESDRAAGGSVEGSTRQGDISQAPVAAGTTVRFASPSANQEIEPVERLESATTQESSQPRPQTCLTPEAQAELRSISLGLHGSQLQQRRMNNFAFEPVSLPVSRAPSTEPSPYSSRQQSTSNNASPMLSPREANESSTPLSTVGSHVENEPRHSSTASISGLAQQTLVHRDAHTGAAPGGIVADTGPSPSAPTTRPSSASEPTSTRPTTLSEGSSMADVFSKRVPGSREASPNRAPGTSSGTATPPTAYSRPLTPWGDEDDPYARNKRRPQSKNLDTIDPRFVFEGKDARRRSAMLGSTSAASGALPRSSSGTDLRNQEKRQSTFSLNSAGGRKDGHGNRQAEGTAAVGGKHHHGSMTELKRFFGIGHHKNKRSQSPAASSKSSKKSVDRGGTKTPPPVSVPFADDHGLANKYGRFGRVLGSGAGGSVRLMKRSSDGVTFAVKQFRDKHPYETERDYAKKVTAEFCIGSTLHHGNIIETLDIIHERDHWYVVMEYAPFDLFAIVMTGKMSREEICCSFLQIVSGVTFLHSMGLAHRDLKLDNVVVNEHGIMKLIDFGSAAVFRYPFETDIVLASGIVGSDPYLAPEVYDSRKYDPQPADIWSLAIIFACMSLRRFPWKAPRLTDNSFKQFVASPTPATPSEALPARNSNGRPPTPAAEDSHRSSVPSDNTASTHHNHDRQDDAAPKQEAMKGPWRLLRLLPRESRNIISHMLELNPKRRATLANILSDPWVSNSPVCSQVEAGQIIRAPGHEHTLEPGNAMPANFSLLENHAFMDFASETLLLFQNIKRSWRARHVTASATAHTHWVNDILLTRNDTALVSASSDTSVKVWRPHAQERQIPTTIGLHSDYVKCLASPGSNADWVASGALDHKIRVWDLNGAGERLCINSGEDETNAKGSVYALSVRGSVMASGGPESIVRLWDARTGKRITKFVGHTDNIRDILINQDGDTVMTASSDQTVKLAIIYSSDRSGLIAKTDLRGSSDWDEGLSLSVAQEYEGVNKVIATGGYLWTATSNSSINRWGDIPPNGEVYIPDQPSHYHRYSASSHSRVPPPASPTAINGIGKPKIPLSCVLRIPNASGYPAPTQQDSDPAALYSSVNVRKMSEAMAEQDFGPVVPYQELPVATIQGQQGLIKHVMLNDKRRVLTLDTAGEVLLWDLIRCIPVQAFGKRQLDDVLDEVNTVESVANWCTVDTRTGRLACILEENYCFDAEMYADELHLEETSELKDDSRINLGKWILRYLFAKLIEEELARDEVYRRQLQLKHSRKIQRAPAPPSIQLPNNKLGPRQNLQSENDSLITPRASNGNQVSMMTSNLAIGVATPHAGLAMNGVSGAPTTDQASTLEKTSPNHSQSRTSTDKPKDYFSANPNAWTVSDQQARPSTPAEDSSETSTQSPADGDKEEKAKEGTTLFGKRFRMNFPKKLGRTSVEVKPPAADEKAEESDKSEEKEERVIEDNFLGTIQRVRYAYEETLHDGSLQPLPSGINPSSKNETPLLEPPLHTTIIIQEDRPDSGGVTDLYRGTVRSVGHDADLVERAGPMWNSRLNANRMLRAKKICAYVAERIEPQPEHPDPNALKPEEYLELYCQDKLVSPNTTLATLRAYIWKTGGDVVLYYKSNGRKPELQGRLTGKPLGDPPVAEGVPF
ncbi:MAG: hypothetical protein Q9210_001677 [Variospora velana]